MTRRFFVEHPLGERTAKLRGGEAHHAQRVMRVGVGDELILFDGSGVETRARVTQLGRNEIALEVCARYQVDRELAVPLTLGVALPKGDRQRWLVEKLVELGVACLVPLQAERSVSQARPNALDRLRRTVIEASKLCGRNRLMQVGEPQSAGEFFSAAPSAAVRVLAHADGDALTAPPGDASAVFAAVGPEGGFTTQELALGRQAGWRMVNLGTRVLRVETAAVALSAFCSLHMAGADRTREREEETRRAGKQITNSK